MSSKGSGMSAKGSGPGPGAGSAKPPAQVYRKVCAQFTTGITVVTVVDAHGHPHGMTVNSFSSVSLEPPLVLVSIDLRNAILGHLHRAVQLVCLNILREGQEQLSRRFSSLSEKAFRGELALRALLRGTPLLDGALAHLECSVVRTFEAGDHTVLIGEVRHAGLRGGKAAGLLRQRLPPPQIQTLPADVWRTYNAERVGEPAAETGDAYTPALRALLERIERDSRRLDQLGFRFAFAGRNFTCGDSHRFRLIRQAIIDTHLAQINIQLRQASAECPGSSLPTAGPRCTSAAHGAADALRNCGPRRSSRGCTSRHPCSSRILICLVSRFLLICSTSRSMILIRSSSVSDMKRMMSSSRFRNSGLNARFTSPRT